jgi:hypothetical protein
MTPILVRKGAQSRTSRETKSNYLLETFVNQIRFALNEIFWNFNHDFPFVSERVPYFRGKL